MTAHSLNASSAAVMLDGPGPEPRTSALPDDAEASATLVRTVHAAVPGRVRFHVEGLKGSDSLKSVLERGIKTLPKVEDAVANPCTGNVLIRFDPALGIGAIADQVAALVRGDVLPPAEDEGEAQATWHGLDSREVAALLGTSPERGLTAEEARERLARTGPNALPRPAVRSGLNILVHQFKNPPTALLAGAVALSVATGGMVEALAILAVAALNGAIGFATEARAERTVRSLGAPATQVVPVIRDGSLSKVSARSLVPGDLILLQRGDVVPADARLATAQSLSVSEAALTGESLPVVKSPGALSGDRVPLAERVNMVHSGTVVTGGSGTALVVATGPGTEVGRIQRLVGTETAPETPMQRQLGQLGGQIAWLSLGVGGAVLGLGWLRGFALLQVLRSALSTAVAAIPEGLPLIATSTLAMGVEDMRRRGVLIRRLDAIETLAAVDVFCFDKTGTLTFNRMEVVAVAFGDGVHRMHEGMLVNRRGEVAARPQDHRRLRRLYEIGALCSETEIQTQGGQTVLSGSATENALVQHALDHGIDVPALRERRPCLFVQHRTEAYRFMATTHRTGSGRILTAVKGSPAEVLERCGFEDGPNRTRLPLTPERRREIEAANAEMADEALRVLGFAYAMGEAGDGSPAADLTWVGLAGMADPIRPDLPDVMAAIHRAGVRTVMMTGDQSATARAVARQLGLSGPGQPIEVVDAAELELWPQAEIVAAARRAHVFARVTPEQKLRIVRALQQAGSVVAMTGDGINDSPALRAADIGIALGRTGTAAANEAADLVLENDDLGMLVPAVERGRATFANIRKSVRYLLGTNLSEVIVVLAGTALGFGEVLSPMQLLWINLVSDVLPGIGLAMQPAEPDAMGRGPRNAYEPLIRTSDRRALAGDAAVIGAGALAACVYGGLRYGADAAQTRTMTFASLAGAQLLHALTCRTSGGGAGQAPDRAVAATLGVSVAIQVAGLVVPGLREILGIAPIGLGDAAVTAAAGLLPYAVNEARKAARTRDGAIALPNAATLALADA